MEQFNFNSEALSLDEHKERKQIIEHRTLKLMIDAVEDYAIFLLDDEGYIKSWNVGAERIKQYTAGEIIGQHFSKFYTVEDQDKDLPTKLLDDARKNGKVSHSGWRLRKNGEKFWADVTITHIKDYNDRPIGFTKITRDLTKERSEQKKYKKKTKLLERVNKELEEFSYTVSHDLRAPLRAMEGFSNILLEEYSNSLDDNVQRYLKKISSNAVKMSKLINDLLSLTKVTKIEIKDEKIDLTSLMKMITKDISDTHEYKNHKVVITELPEVEGDPILLKQVFQNLLNNAMKYSAKVKNPKVEVSGKLNPLNVEISIRDNGIGFDMKYSDKIFGIFQRLHNDREYEGTGIGLAIVKKILQQHHGGIIVTSEPNKGTEFKVFLPRNRKG